MRLLRTRARIYGIVHGELLLFLYLRPGEVVLVHFLYAEKASDVFEMAGGPSRRDR